MLHLFNKVYLEYDDNIEINFDRVVISERYGNQMHHQLELISYGALLGYGKTYESVIGTDFVGFITSLNDHGKKTDKKIIVYCDKPAYKKIITKWFKTILPNLDLNSFKTLIDYSIYNQRVVSNTQLASVYSIDLTSLWEGLGDIEESWEAEEALTSKEKDILDGLNLNYSYEFLLASHLAGDESVYPKFKKTFHMFVKRWWKENLTDNRQTVLLNISNHKFLEHLGVNPEEIDITSLDPLSGIEVFEPYADDEIWERDQNQYGLCKLEGLSEEKYTALVEFLFKVYEFEGFPTDKNLFEMGKYIKVACEEEADDQDIEDLVDVIINNPFDTCFIPRFDFQNVNFPLIQHFLNKKNKGEDLSKFRLL